jgi:hypothetical protein
VAGHVAGRGSAVRLAEAIVTRVRNRGMPGYRGIPLDAGGIFIDSLRHAESFRVACRPDSQLLEVAEDGCSSWSGPQTGPSSGVAHAAVSLKGRGLMSLTELAAWLVAADGRAGGYLR